MAPKLKKDASSLDSSRESTPEPSPGARSSTAAVASLLPSSPLTGSASSPAIIAPVFTYTGATSYSSQGSNPVMAAFLLFGIMILACSVRMFAVLRYEAMIHEFDPNFNFRATKVLVEKGIYEFLNWFDDRSWYPLGRLVGTTIYPGLMVTAGFGHWLLNFMGFAVSPRVVCVFTAPLFSSLTSLVAFWMGYEVKGTSSGLVAAFFMALSPGYVSRSVAGSYDNEAVAIFAMLLVFTCWVKAVKTGAIAWGGMASLAYFYMVAAWGGYIFVINLIPLYCVVMWVTGRFSLRLYVAYSVFYMMGNLMSMQPFNIGFLPYSSPEHLASHGVFVLFQVILAYEFARKFLTKSEMSAVLRRLGFLGAVAAGGMFVLAFMFVPNFSGRAFSLLNPSGSHMAIVKSVSEHQPPGWTTFYNDLHFMLFLVPLGIYVCCQDMTDASLFLVMYGVLSTYFASVMVRLVLVLAPPTCVLAGIGFSTTLQEHFSRLKFPKVSGSAHMTGIRQAVSTVVVIFMCLVGSFYVIHCSWVSSEAYSHPSIVLASNQPDGTRLLFDDYREAYFWLRENTPYDAKVMSWWDYGYQLAEFADRTTLVDNNTWNNSHIAQVGQCMATNEQTSVPHMNFLDVDYVLVVFGGMIGYSSDDINKFLWMVRIGGSTDPSIKEEDYMSPMTGSYKIDKTASKTMLDSMMYKMCYHRFAEQTGGHDRTRGTEIGDKNPKFEYLEEAFTSHNWMVRIYRNLGNPNHGVVVDPKTIVHGPHMEKTDTDLNSASQRIKRRNDRRRKEERSDYVPKTRPKARKWKLTKAQKARVGGAELARADRAEAWIRRTKK